MRTLNGLQQAGQTHFCSDIELQADGKASASVLENLGSSRLSTHPHEGHPRHKSGLGPVASLLRGTKATNKAPCQRGSGEGLRQQAGLDGLGSVPRLLFFGTVVPASQLPTRNHILRNASARNNGSQGMIFRYRGISTPSKTQPFFSTGRFPARCHPDRGRSSAMLTADFQGADASGGVKSRTLCAVGKGCGF